MFEPVTYPVELIKLAMRSHILSAIANFGSILVFVFALIEFIPTSLLFSWFIIHCTIMLLRFYYFHKVKIKLQLENIKIKQNYHHELTVLTSLFFTSGILWGISIWLSVIYAPMAYIFLCIVLLLGLAGGAIATLSPIQHIYSAFIFPIIFLQFFALIYTGESIYFYIAILTILYTPVVYKASLSFYAYMLDGIQQRQELEKARQEAEIANHEKSNFLANMSHEIRTPLNGIVALIQLLSRKKLDAEQNEIVNKMDISAQILQDLLHDILDLAKIESGKFNLESINFSPVEIINECLLTCDSQATEKGLKIKTMIKSSVPDHLFGDSNCVSQIILNLVGNAIKFTETGQITISLDTVEDKESEILLLLSVTDTGIGISEADHDKIFNNFTQSDNDIARQYGGTGLGLSICKHLLNLMGGNICVQSQLGEGSTFICHIPMSQVTEATELSKHKNIRRNLHEMNILVIDDDEINRYAINGLLEEEGVHVMLAESGNIALELAKQEKFDLVLMDLHMPGLNGWDTTRLFRASPLHQLSHVPIIGLTADVLKESHKSCLEAGMNSVVSKPFKFPELLKQIQNLTEL